MKLTTALLATATFLTCSYAQQYPTQSPPFNLFLESDDSSLNGQQLGTCHEGAAIESLCAGNGGPFYFNTSSTSSTVGILTWVLHGGNFDAPSSLQFSYNPASNVVVPLLFPGDSSPQQVAFDSDDYLYVNGLLDTTNPPTTEPLYRWNWCQTNAGYLMYTVAWIMGDGPPSNPTCQPVKIKRTFIQPQSAKFRF